MNHLFDIFLVQLIFADLLAKIGTGLQNDFVIFSNPPVDLLSILEDDVCGVSVNRLCPVVLAAV